MQKGDWIFDGCDSFGKAKSDIYEVCGRMHVDVVLYARSGERIGRMSPPMGGPRHFEPACSAEDWTVVKKPKFPLSRYSDLRQILVRQPHE